MGTQKLDYAIARIDSDAAGAPWRGISALILLVAVPVSGWIPLSPYELNPMAYIPPIIFTAMAGMVGWRAVRSKQRMDKLVGVCVMVVAILLIAFFINDRVGYLLR